MKSQSRDDIWKELEIAQTLIARQESNRHQFRNWYVGILTALLIAFASKEITIEKNQFLILSGIITLIFYILEFGFGASEGRIINRSNELEEILRTNGEYDGPKIGLSLRPIGKRYLPKRSDIKFVRMTFTYLIMFLCSLIIYFVK